MASSPLKEGSRVRLMGLTNSPQLNGAEGIIIGPAAGSPTRYPVKLLRPPTLAKAHPAGVNVKLDNLQALQQPPAQPSSSAASTAAAPTAAASTASAESHGSKKSPAGSAAAGGLLDPVLRSSLAAECVRRFMDALDDDMYPDEATERIFGVQMKPQSGKNSSDLRTWPIGNLTFGAWITIRNMYCEAKSQLYGVYDDADGEEEEGGDYDAYQRKLDATMERIRRELMDDITRAILDGRLPQWYEEQLRGLEEAGQASYYVVEILRRGCGGIPWDSQMLGRLAGRF